MTAAGSATPLGETLGLKRGMRCWFHDMPEAVRAALDPKGLGVEEQPTPSDGLQCAHLFVTRRAKLQRELAALRPLMASNGFIWVSWPLAPDGDDLDLSEPVVRAMADEHRVDAQQACTIRDNWVAMKLSMRRDDS